MMRTVKIDLQTNIKNNGENVCIYELADGCLSKDEAGIFYPILAKVVQV